MIKFILPEGATPLDPNEMEGLIPNISTQRELNQLEKANNFIAYNWAIKSRKLKKELVSIHGVKLLHKKMFDEIWEWAGQFRKTEKNIGTILSHQVQEEVKKLCDDINYQISLGVSNWKELTVTTHHRLVSIHPFSNGNGRHARLFCDLLLIYNKQSPLSWGASDLIENDLIRKNYIQCLRLADKGDIKPLIEFCS